MALTTAEGRSRQTKKPRQRHTSDRRLRGWCRGSGWRLRRAESNSTAAVKFGLAGLEGWGGEGVSCGGAGVSGALTGSLGRMFDVGVDALLGFVVCAYADAE